MEAKKLKCKKCGSSNIQIEVKTYVRYCIDKKTGQSFTEGEGDELEMSGIPFCEDCSEDYGNLIY